MLELFQNAIKTFSIILRYWWLWSPVLTYYLFYKAWMYYIQRKFWREFNWIVLEIKPPRDIEKSPKTTEQMFAGLWSLMGTVGNNIERFVKGFIQAFISFEIVSIGGKIHFFIRTPARYRNMIESQIYAQYPEAEITEVEDYALSVPQRFPNKEWDMWGTRLTLTMPDAYPIKTYMQFAEAIPSKEFGFIDPLASLLEALAKFKEGEQAWIQIFIRPTTDEWKSEGIKIVQKLMGRVEKRKVGLFEEEIRTWGVAASAVTQELVTGKPSEIEIERREEEMPEMSNIMRLSPGEREVVESIEKNIAKKGFQSKVQIVYIAKKDVFSKPVGIPTIMAAFNQFNALNLNGFRPDLKITTKANYLFVEERLNLKKNRLLKMARLRTFWERGYVLNVEELATIFHFPTIAVQAPAAPKIETKRGGPPIGLPVGEAEGSVTSAGEHPEEKTGPPSGLPTA